MTLDAKTCQSLTLNSLLVGYPEERILIQSLICFQSTCHIPPVIAGQIFSWCDDNNDCYVTDSECRNHSEVILNVSVNRASVTTLCQTRVQQVHRYSVCFHQHMYLLSNVYAMTWNTFSWTQCPTLKAKIGEKQLNITLSMHGKPSEHFVTRVPSIIYSHEIFSKVMNFDTNNNQQNIGK